MENNVVKKVKRKNNLKYLSKENVDLLKGFFALCVVIHHARACMIILNDTYLGMILTASGYLSVAMFYFFSGYGLEKQYQLNEKKYINSFFKNRIVAFYILYILILSIYLLIGYL